MKLTDNYYNIIADSYNELHQEEQMQKLEISYKYFVENFKNIESINSILDVGSGSGISSDFWAKKGFKVTGIDPAKKLINTNKNKGNFCEFIEASAEKIPFKNNSFDLVVSYTAIQNFEDIEKGLNEIKRVGKNMFILTFLNNVKDKELIESTIERIFNIYHRIEGKDIILFQKENKL